MTYEEKKAQWYKKWRASIIKKYGSWEAYVQERRESGRKGGLTGSNGLAKMTPKQRSEAGKAGHKAMIEKLMRERNETSNNV